MIPNVDILTNEITETTYPTKTYKILIDGYSSSPYSVTNNDGVLVVNVTNPNNVSTRITEDSVLLVTTINNKYSATIKNNVLEISSNVIDKTHLISNYVDGLDAVKQAVYLILSSERYKHIIYSWDYGVELLDLIGKPMPYVLSELPRRIKEALTQDDRITDVIDFEFKPKGNQLHATFTVVSNVGDISTELEVAV
jgi:hypothetical protein